MKQHTKMLGLILGAILLGGYGCTLSVEDVDLDTSPYLEGNSSSQGLSNLSATSSTGLSSGGVSSSGDESRDLIRVDCGVGGTCTPGDTTVPLGTSLLLTFTANANYAIDSISLNGVVRFASDTTSALYDSFEVALKNIQGNYDIVVRFKALPSSSSETVSSAESSSAGSSSSVSSSSAGSSAVSSSSLASSSSSALRVTVDCGVGGICSPGTMENVSPGTTQKFTFTADAGKIIDTVVLDDSEMFNSDTTSTLYGSFALTLGNIQVTHHFVVRFKAISSSSSSLLSSSSTPLSSSSALSSSAGSSAVSSSSLTPGTITRFDFTQSTTNFGEGHITADASGKDGSNPTAKVEAKHSNNNWYPMAGWEISDADCPNGAGGCWWGWNDDDAKTAEGFSVRVSLLAYVQPSGWGYTNGGVLYIFKGTQLETAGFVDIGSTISVKVKGASGKKMKLYLYDEPHIGGTVPKYSFTATGEWQNFTLTASDFVPATGINLTRVKALALQYELTAANQGAAISQAEGYPITELPMVWQSLKTEL